MRECSHSFLFLLLEQWMIWYFLYCKFGVDIPPHVRTTMSPTQWCTFKCNVIHFMQWGYSTSRVSMCGLQAITHELTSSQPQTTALRWTQELSAGWHLDFPNSHHIVQNVPNCGRTEGFNHEQYSYGLRALQTTCLLDSCNSVWRSFSLLVPDFKN